MWPHIHPSHIFRELTTEVNPIEKACKLRGATIFFGIGGVMDFRKYLGNIFVTPVFDDQKFYDPPLWSYNVEETCNPPMRVAQKICILGAISLNKIFIKICSHPKIS